ncbi:hypothetical protein HGRIS_009562 [Hohenbuehelia grisea]|uniref:Beta-catenin-like protein 1 N-terminal domain-containing protein n=1 Tax=Hohenbuehelia grisea TaxID=104357 RepID=A0ABR3J2X3_9AGAR
MDIDSLFKVPKLPSGTKRKLPDNPSPEMLKKMRMDTSSTSSNGSAAPPNGASASSKGKSRAVTVEEVEDVDADRSFAPGGDADYFTEEDDEGRFFGGGLTSEQKEILNIFESAQNEEEEFQEDLEIMSLAAIKRILIRFERAASKNQDQRSKYPDDPTKFIDSEADLDAALKSLLPLAQSPIIAYPELVESGTIKVLIGLLAHENADIVIDVVEVIHELTDEDVGNEGEDEDDAENNQTALRILIEHLLENSIMELLVDNLSRLNESEESDRQGVFHILGIFENILGFDPKLATGLVANTKILPWLLTRIELKQYDENRGYAAELLSILLQDNTDNRLAFGKMDGVEACLKVISQYRRRDPADADETEFMENVFDTLCSALIERNIKDLFLAAEGPDLMVLIMKEKLQAMSRSIKTLDYAMSGTNGTAMCEAFIEALGLKTLFAALMGKTSKKQKQGSSPPANEDTQHVLGIILSLFANLPSDSPARIRVLAKFVESNYEKVDRLLDIRDHASNRLKATDADIEVEKKALIADGEEVGSEEQDAWYLRRLDGGLFNLQSVDYILAWIIMEDDGIRIHVERMLGRKNLSVRDIVNTLRIFYENVDEEPNADGNDGPERSLSQKEILYGLISALDTDTQS